MKAGPQIPELQFYTPSKDQNSYRQQQIKSKPSQPYNQRLSFEQFNKQNVIKNYIFGQTIGQGTFNKVKIARHIPTDQKVAIKIIDKSSIQNQADKKRLDLQLKILRKVRHPNIAQLFQIFQNKNYLFLVTQHVSRGQLFDHILNNQKLTQFQSCKFLQQLLDAVQYIHSLGVAHRDLKPENILLDYKFNIKLIDFGLSNIYSKDQLLLTACGSPCYASPEMLSGKPYNGLKSDIWSVGVILYAMCFGYLPFDNPNQRQIYQSIREGKYDIPDHASKQLRSILSIILNVDAQQRASIDQIRSHPFCKFSPLRLTPGIIVGLSDIPYEQQIQEQIIEQIYSDKKLYNQQKQQLKKKLKYSIKYNKHNQLSSTYYLLLQRNLKFKNQTLVNYYIKLNNSINRYSIAEKVKLIYDKKLQERYLNQTKNHSPSRYSPQKNKKNKSKSKTYKKQNIHVVELYDRNKQKQHLNQQRRLKTTNTKRKKDLKDNQTDKIFKKTRLNFNQIQLQLKQKHQQSDKKHKQSDKKHKQSDKKLINDKNNKSQRFRNKSVTAAHIHKHFQKSPVKKQQRSPNKSIQKSSLTKIQKSPAKNKKQNHVDYLKELSSKKKRSKSQNTFYNKTQRFNIQQNPKKKIQRRQNIRNNQISKQRSPVKMSHKKLKVKINQQIIP